MFLIERKIFKDQRGFFSELFNKNISDVINENFVQDNISCSKNKTIRGMHYQWSSPMGKLVSCIYGEINDFIVDIRKDSDTLGKVFKFNLKYNDKFSLWVPPGFAHGFEVLSENAVVHYKCTSYYNKEAESGINPFDSHLAIPWETNIDEF